MKTLQEFADFLGMIMAVDEDGDTYAYESEPEIRLHDDWQEDGYWYSGDDSHYISPYLINYDGRWEDSLTFPKEKQEWNSIRIRF